MKIKTSELQGAALDWAVAKCVDDGLADFTAAGWRFYPSTNWAQGGPIIEREDIAFRKYHHPGVEAHGKYYARVCRESGTLVGWYKTTNYQQTGPTPLIAAMRCLVASKMGSEVDVPEELLP